MGLWGMVMGWLNVQQLRYSLAAASHSCREPNKALRTDASQPTGALVPQLHLASPPGTCTHLEHKPRLIGICSSKCESLRGWEEAKT